MISSPPVDETARLAALHAYHILDTPPDETCDDLTRLAAIVCGTPIASLALLDAERVWFKSIIGMEIREAPRTAALCTHAILQSEVFVIADTLQDERLANNPFVTGEQHIRFYAAAPLMTADGHTLGFLCVADRTPRHLTEDQMAGLRVLARQATSRLEMSRVEAAHIASETNFRRLTESGVIGINFWDLDGRITWVNDRFLEMTGYDRADLQAGRLRWDEMTPEEWREATSQAVCQLRENGTFGAYEKEFWRQDGTRVPVLLGGALLDGGTEGISFILDLTKQKRAEQGRLQDEETIRLLAGAVSYAVNGMTIVDARQPGMPIVYCNPMFEEMTGYSASEVIGRNCRFLQGEDTAPDPRREIREAIQAGRACRITLLNYRKDGSTFWNEMNIAPMHDDQQRLTHFVGVQRDVTELRKAEQQIRDDNLVLEVRKVQLEAANAELAALATTDPMTGLLNHHAFQACLEQTTENGRAGGVAAVAVLDLDNFRFFNDAYGHAAGDSVLRMVAERLREVCTGRDAVAHFGGDEFTLLLSDIGQATVPEIEGRLKTALDGLTFLPGDHATAIPLTATVGAALLSHTGQGRSEAMHKADERLRWLKSGGGVETEAGRVRHAMLTRIEGFSMLDALVVAVDNKDRYTRRHSEDVLAYSIPIAAALGWDARAQDTVAVAALLHDVGKIGVPDHILRKPGRLTDVEFEAVKQHPMMGAIMVSAVPGLEGTLDAVRHHHERWDGGGYPFGLRGEETPPIARLMAVADAYSAMTTDRPYRQGMEAGRAQAILTAGAGTQWDPDCVTAFLDSFTHRPFAGD